jgi:hypothetical protein
MADINQVISLGIGTPAGILEFLTLGLQIGAASAPIYMTISLPVRVTAGVTLPTRATAEVSLPTRAIAEVELEV